MEDPNITLLRTTEYCIEYEECPHVGFQILFSTNILTCIVNIVDIPENW